ncbi:ABC transporter ATP-binding protein [Paenibacillus alkalitolerans]|uniref:ABC transporter ATP-binding protein n=1 Tax=Paenibacillus alkalitolerans TaxID=2799335 RepID=UPI0018F6AEC5|nr:ABC transporter ATP-binding protein [Paenibacillus alkalitolerans]
MEASFTRRILSFFRPYHLSFVFVILLSLLAALLSLTTPLLMKEIIDHAIPAKDIRLLVILCGCFFAVVTVGGMLSVWQSHREHIVGQQVLRDIRMVMMERLQLQSMRFFTHSRSGEIVHRLISDVQMIQNIAAKSVITAVTQFIFWCTAAGILFFLDYRLAVFSLLLLPTYVIPSRKTAKKRKALMSETQEWKSTLSSFISEAFGISGALLTRIFGREAWLKERFSTVNQNIMEKELKLNLLGQWITMFNGALPAVGTVMIYLYGGYSVIQGTMTIGDMVAFTIYLGRLYGPTQQLLNLYMDFVTSMGVFQRIFEYLDLVPDVAEKDNARELPDVKGDISFDSVSFAYSAGKNVLHHINFEVSAGQQLAVVGPSGAGKTTLIGMLARLYDPTSGCIRFDGVNIKEVKLNSIRKHIAYVTQDPFLFHASIRENLLFAKPDATDEELVKACKDAYIHDLIHSLPNGYDTIVGERGHRLSSGERQRLAIARAVLKKPRILILDEATSHLDSQSEHYVQSALETLMRSCTTVVIAHRLSTIVAADQILVLKDGKIAEKGNHHELLIRNSLYADLYRKQFADAI